MLYLETIIPNIELCTLNFDKYYHEHCSPQHNVINGENGLYSLIVAIQSICVKIDKLSSSVCACSAYKHSMKDISQRFWLFSKCHCQNTYIDMDIPQISACRGISVAFKCTFRVSGLKHFVDKIISGSMPFFSILLLETFFSSFHTTGETQAMSEYYVSKLTAWSIILIVQVSNTGSCVTVSS